MSMCLPNFVPHPVDGTRQQRAREYNAIDGKSKAPLSGCC